jgi:hypothetical protein
MFKKILKYTFLSIIIIIFRGARLFAQFKLDDHAMRETSGVAASRIHPGILYIHNDSGDSSRFFAINHKGELKTTFYFKGTLTTNLQGVRDCEDIAVGPGPDKLKSYIYLGDIGNNSRDREYLTIYRFEEPEISNQTSSKIINGDPLYIHYPDGPRDAEALMIDPIDRLIYIVTKREDSVGVYTVRLDFNANDTLLLNKKSQIHLKGVPGLKWITSSDISADGSQILIKSYEKVFYWKRKPNEPVWEAVKSMPEELPYTIELQGEAIGFDAEGKGYYTISEGKNAPVYYYKIP